MRGSKSSSRVRAMELVADNSPKPEPQLSGAYIRSLVKHLSSSMPKENNNQAMNNPKSPNSTLDEAQPLQSPPPQPQPPKKQVRRRLHTTRPYQERLLNMAEARREIVTALKFHRASMKQQANEHEQQQAQQPPNPNPFTYPSLSWFAPPPPNTISDIALNFPLPDQPLGLNLNFQGFTNIDTPLYKDPLILPPLSPHSSSSSSSYSYVLSPPMCSMQTQVVHDDVRIDLGESNLHPAMDEREMAEIRSIGERHDMEWNDKVNVVTSAWWSEVLERMEVDSSPGDIPAWLEDGSTGHHQYSLMQQDMDDYYLQDASLPW